MGKILKRLPLFALISVPFIIFQWSMKLLWLRLDAQTYAYSYLYLVSILYAIACILVYQGFRMGYYMMLVISVLLLSSEIILLDLSIYSLLVSIDTWVNLAIIVSQYVWKKYS